MSVNAKQTAKLLQKSEIDKHCPPLINNYFRFSPITDGGLCI